MKRNKSGRAVVSADGAGVVSHAGIGLLREMAEETDLVGGLTAALLDTYRGVPVHSPGKVLTDLAVAVADGADSISGISVLTDREELFGRSPRCRRRGWCWTASTRVTWNGCEQPGRPLENEGGPPVPDPT